MLSEQALREKAFAVYELVRGYCVCPPSVTLLEDIEGWLCGNPLQHSGARRLAAMYAKELAMFDYEACFTW